MSFVIPEDVTTLGADELSSAVEAAMKEFAPIAKLADDKITDEQADQMVALSGFVTAAKAHSATLEAAAAERTEKLAAIRESMTAKPEEKVEDAVVEPVVEATAVEAATAVESEAPVVEPEIVDEIVVDEEVVDVSDKEALVAAGAPVKRTVSDLAAGNAKAPVVAERERGSIVASAGVPGVEGGHKFGSFAEASELITSRLRAFGSSQAAGTYSRQSILQLRPSGNALNQNDFQGRDTEMLMQASNERALEGSSLVAAGGWGAPSDTILDFCSIETTDGLLSLPEVVVTRGGLNYTKGPDFGAVLASATGFWDLTEAQVEAGTAKTSIVPAVPDFIDKRLDAVGFMLEAGLLTRAGWPELVNRYSELTLIAHAHKVAAKSLAEIKAFTGAAINVPNGFGNAIDLFSILELVAAGERQRTAMSLNATLEVILPLWVKPAIRADLANRAGVENFLNFTDAQIDAAFSTRKMRVQWIYTSQKLDVTAGIATKYPDFVEAYMYPAGTYVRGVSDVVSLDTVYDSTNLKKNQYVHLFVEQGTVVTNPCNTGRAIKIPFGINGRTGAADIKNNFTAVPVP